MADTTGTTEPREASLAESTITSSGYTPRLVLADLEEIQAYADVLAGALGNTADDISLQSFEQMATAIVLRLIDVQAKLRDDQERDEHSQSPDAAHVPALEADDERGAILHELWKAVSVLRAAVARPDHGDLAEVALGLVAGAANRLDALGLAVRRRAVQDDSCSGSRPVDRGQAFNASALAEESRAMLGQVMDGTASPEVAAAIARAVVGHLQRIERILDA